jgi:hypothetical protein
VNVGREATSARDVERFGKQPTPKNSSVRRIAIINLDRVKELQPMFKNHYRSAKWETPRHDATCCAKSSEPEIPLNKSTGTEPLVRRTESAISSCIPFVSSPNIATFSRYDFPAKLDGPALLVKD